MTRRSMSTARLWAPLCRCWRRSWGDDARHHRRRRTRGVRTSRSAINYLLLIQLELCRSIHFDARILREYSILLYHEPSACSKSAAVLKGHFWLSIIKGIAVQAANRMISEDGLGVGENVPHIAVFDLAENNNYNTAVLYKSHLHSGVGAVFDVIQ
ncbi:hypothetical protein HYPSUDRAFT_396207 [Hypholoma sublateritium FD-334 SS-4]|uniref:Uncharacterized protein n=1 Tax=Hypholoma sublateritium (strain FD-334 SS-4) TaxID=945553 RepID=A0A0D2P403_HYPSF|nr:hypothetical protein HYPSUDRAFT_396207 [Hypholoma sublateritium FD-334 SS-4]